jgi:hypothetical protein
MDLTWETDSLGARPLNGEPVTEGTYMTLGVGVIFKLPPQYDIPHPPVYIRTFR